jgi:two-component system, LytTR family, response regulator
MSAPNNKLRIIIIDDEYHGRENLKSLLENYCPEVEISGMADSVQTGIKLIALQPDVVFLDVNMPVLDGFDLLNEYEEREFKVVIVSGYSEYAIKAVKAGAYDYILKPINIKELKLTVRKLISQKQKSLNNITESEKVIIPNSHGFNVAEINKIVRIEAVGNYTKVFTNDGKNVIVSRTLKKFEDSISKKNFFRVHKSHLINIHFIKEYKNKDGFHVIMTDGSNVEVSRRKVADFIQKIKSMIDAV